MNACDDGDEPVGEAPEVTMPRAVALVDRQTQALKEIRSYLTTVDVMPFVRDSFDNGVISGKKNAMAVVAAILDRNGLC